MKVFEALANAALQNGTDVMFGVIGDANLYMVDHFIWSGRARYVAATNEGSAVLMALGHASVTGKVGVATITHGPALTNTITALVEGVKGSMPVVLLCGDTSVMDKHHLQNVPQRELVLAAGAGFEQLRGVGTVAEDVATAFRRAVLERRPIVLNMPVDLQWQEADYSPRGHTVPVDKAVVPSSADLDNAIGIIAAARRPVILAGRGATMSEGARESLVRLADRIEAPLATTLKARDFFKGDPFNLGIFGTLSHEVGAEAIAASDCVIAFGASLNRFTTAGGALLKQKRVVQVNAEASEVGRLSQPDAGIVGDPQLTAELMLRWLDEAEIAPSGFRDADLRVRLATCRHKSVLFGSTPAGTVDIRHAMLRLEGALPSDRIVVCDAGRFMGEALQLFGVENPRSFVYTVNFGSIGLGLAQAIGAAAGGRPTVLLVGDGGLMLGGLSEFHTAVREQSDLIVILSNDGAYGAEHIQFRAKQMDPTISTFTWPDMANVATAMGGRGMSVRNPQDLENAARAIAERDRPLLIDIRLDADHMPEIPH